MQILGGDLVVAVASNMRIRQVSIRNFRGIRACDWRISSRFVCLVGPGGSTKSTLMDAIGLALSHSYRERFTDADFHKGKTDAPITIEVVVSDLPDDLIEERALGKDRSGITPEGELKHDPEEGTEECLIVRLSVDETLEPTWAVVRPGDDKAEPQSITAGQRAKLGFFRVGEDVNRHLRWIRTSALTAMTENRSGATAAVVEAHREARSATFEATPQELADTAKTVQARAYTLGSGPFKNLRPGVDPIGAASALSLILHDDEVPLTNEGLGTRRLTSLAVQELAVAGGSIMGVDEIEAGLEPHRLAHILRYLKERTTEDQMQVFLTTHSSVAVTALSATDLAVVRCNEGATEIREVDGSLDPVQGTVRAASSGLLARRVLVGEGATEVGFARGLCVEWDHRQGDDVANPTSATVGLGLVNGGGGAQAVRRAGVFAELGYETATLLDNDDSSIDAALGDLSKVELEVIRWSQGNALEDEIVDGLELDGLAEFVSLGVEARGESSVLQGVGSLLGVDSLDSTDPRQWVASGIAEADVRRAVAATARGKRHTADGGDASDPKEKYSWFKREDGGEQLAAFVLERRQDFKNKPLAERLRTLKTFIYDNPETPAADTQADAT